MSKETFEILFYVLVAGVIIIALERLLHLILKLAIFKNKKKIEEMIAKKNKKEEEKEAQIQSFLTQINDIKSQPQEGVDQLELMTRALELKDLREKMNLLQNEPNEKK